MRPVLLLVLLCCLVGVVSSWTGNVCSRVRTKCEWRWGCRYRTWNACCAWGYISVEVQYTEYFCCTGWTHNGNRVCDKAICPYDCGGSSKGTCIRPGVCQCKPGYAGTYCTSVADCSHLKPCYPGYCTSSGCTCTNKFSPESSSGTSNCLNYPNDDAYYPSIEQSTLKIGYYHQVKQMLIYNMTIDSAMSIGNVETFWTNRRDANRMDFTFQSIFITSTLNFPSRPSYISQHDFGITAADVRVELTRYNGSKPFSTLKQCSDVSRDNPKKETLFRCDTSIDDFPYRFDSGDTYSATFRAENGGYRTLNNGGGRQYYTGKETTKRIELKFDTETPYHCSKNPSECSVPSSSMMSIQKDVTKEEITISWRGWKDQLSKVARYALEVFKLVKAGDGTLKEPYTDLVPNPVPITIREFNETSEGGPHSFKFTPSEPGVYSWILEINDRANNSAYVRRFVIFDPVSTVTSDNNNPIKATSGNSKANYEWQNNNPQTVSLSWKNHFLNELHENGDFLARIRRFTPALDDGGDRTGYKRIDKYDDTEGKRSRDAIPNERGIINYDIAHAIGGSQLTPSTYQYTDYVNTSIEIPTGQTLQDGNSFTIWVKAYDILGNTKEERFVLHYDSSGPNVNSLQLQKNIGEDDMNFKSSIHILGATDPNSGVKRINYRFIAQSSKKVISDKDYWFDNPQRDDSYCITNPCDQNLPTGEMFGRTIDLQFSNCDAMNVSDISSETVKMEMDIYNSAGLFVSRSIEISNLTSLRGVNDYFGPMNLRIADSFKDSLKIMWDQAPSCYNIRGFQFINAKADGQVIENTTLKEVQDWILLHRVAAGETYILTLHTLYGDSKDNEIKSKPSTFQFTMAAPEGPKSQTGAIVGGVSGALIFIIILLAIFLIFMVRTRRMQNPIDRFRSTSSKSTSGPFVQNDFDTPMRPNNKSKAYNNRAYSQEYGDDVYYAENETPLRYQIVRSRITFEEEIARGKFAIIYKAKYLRDNTSNTVVAKTMKENPSQSDIESMHAKVNFYTLKIGEHPNVLKFIGVVDDDVLGRFMVLEYCENGQLKEYLKSNKHKVNDEMHEKLYRFACGICKGMNYLASQGVVHRRLAARNILLTFLLETKITGFGPEPREDDGGDNKTVERVPIKWVAPECIRTTKHATERSDVWSYGVVLWEIFSMGEAPYEGYKSAELDSQLKKGVRLKKPEHCDDMFYKIMKKCWAYESGKRPNFEEILDELQTLFTGDIDGDEYYYSQNGLYDNRK